MTSRPPLRPLPFASGAGPAIIVPILAPTPAEAADRARAAAAAAGVVVLEWRIDEHVAGGLLDAGAREAAGTPEVDGSAELRTAYDGIAAPGVPVLVTVRSQTEGGHCPDDRYAEAVEAAIALRPAAVDVEMGREEAGRLLAAASDAGVSTVVSAHAWEATPTAQELDAAFAVMAGSGADVVKIAVTPQSTADVLTLLGATARAAESLDVPVIGIAMGELGRVSRLCGGEFGSAATFATVGEGSAPGQMTAEQVAVVRSYLPR